MSAMRSRPVFFVSLLSILLVPLSLNAQDSATGSIGGVVLDAAGARVPWASIVVVNTATSKRHMANSDSEGRFVVGMLAPGDYSARVEADGMSHRSLRRYTSTSAAQPSLNFASPSPERRRA